MTQSNVQAISFSDTDTSLPGVSGKIKDKSKGGRPNWRWGPLSRELHGLYLLSCHPAHPIVLPDDIAGAARHLVRWMKDECTAGRVPADMKGLRKALAEDPNFKPEFSVKKLGDRISDRHKATSLRDLQRFMGGAEAYRAYYERMLQVRDGVMAARLTGT